MPERTGEWELAPIEVPFFDPAARKFRVASSRALTLSVRGTRRTAQVDGESVELHPIRTAALPAVGAGASFGVLQPWLFGATWVIGLLVLALRHRGGSGHRPARRHFLSRLDEAAHEERPRQAAALIEDAWRDYLNERWEIHEGAPSTQWAKLLALRGVESDGAEALVKLADDIHYLRYAPKLSSIDELRRELVERSRKLVRTVG